MLIGRYHLGTLFLSALLLGLVFMGCGDSNIFDSMADDSTSEAKLEEAQIALDKGDYSTAVDILLGLCGLSAEDPASGAQTCDNDTISLLASAYIGRAGLDLIELIESAETSTGSQTFTEFSNILVLTNAEDMQNAVDLLDSLGSARTPEQSLQMAVAATADVILDIGGITDGFDPTTGLPDTIPSVTDPATIDAANEITGNISLILEGIGGSGIADADMSADITTIQRSLSDPSGTNPNDITVTSDDLVTYLQNL